MTPDEPLRFTDHGDLDEQTRPVIAPGESTKIATPPSRPERPPWYGWAVERDVRPVEPGSARWVRQQPGYLDRPSPHWFTWWGLGVCVGIITMTLIVATFTDRPAPRSAPVIPPAGTSEASAAPATPSDAGQGSTGAPVPSPSAASTGEVGPAMPPVALAGWATWCAPTPTQCQEWGGEAKLGAVPTFRFGDEPYDVVVVHRGREVVVTVVSFCACRDRHGIPTVIDLSPAAIAELTPTWRRDGIIRVHVEGVPDQHPQDPPEHPDDARMRLEVLDDELYR
jgi:hypothetical protein